MGYNKSPSPSDRAHCLVNLIPADKIALMDDEVIKKMRAIRLVASDLGKWRKWRKTLLSTITVVTDI